MNVGAAYTWKLGHLYVVVGVAADGSVAVVNFSEWKDNRDQSCVADVGDHPVFTKKSVVVYKGAEMLSLAAQAEMLRFATRRDDVSPALLRRIQEGTDSDYCPEKIQKCVNDWCKAQRIAARAAANAVSPNATPAPTAPAVPDPDGSE